MRKKTMPRSIAELEKMNKAALIPIAQEFHKKLNIPFEHSDTKSKIVSILSHSEIKSRANKDDLIRYISGCEVMELEPVKEVEPVKVVEAVKEVNILELLGLNEKETAIVKKASESSNISVMEIIKSGAILKARKINSELQRLSELKTEKAIKNTTLMGSANKGIEICVNKLIAWNNAQPDKNDNDKTLKVFICASIVRSITKSNLNTINRFLENYRSNDQFKETIEQHNKRHKLNDSDNKKGRDAEGNRINIYDLISNFKPVISKPETVLQVNEVKEVKEVKNMTYSEFAKYIDSLEDVSSVKLACEELTNNLRDRFKKIKETSKQQAVALHNELQAYRAKIKELPLKSSVLYTHTYGAPRTLKPGEAMPKGAALTEDGRIESIPQHSALKYLVLTKQENDLRK